MINKADIGFLTMTDSWVSRHTAEVLQCKYAHTFLVLDVTPSRTYILDTNRFDVNINTLEYYRQRPNTDLCVWSADLSEDLREKMVQAAIPAVNSAYGYGKAIMSGLVHQLSRFNITLQILSGYGRICSEDVMTAYTLSGIPSLQGVDPLGIDVAQLYRTVSEGGHFKRLI